VATPILTASPSTVSLTPGGSATVTVTATDPDAGTATLHIVGTDGEGNPATVDVTVQMSDPIDTWAASVDDPDLAAGFINQSGTGATVVVSWPSS
jgi:hypothetical protein